MSATYVFKAIDLVGVQSKGELDADSKQAVTDQLKSRGLIVLDIAEKRSSKEIELPLCQPGQVRRPDDHDPPARDDGVARHDDPARAVRARGADREQEAQGDARRVRKDVEAGLPLSDALERHPKVFDPLFVAMTRAGETGGVLDSALIRVADQLEKADRCAARSRAP